MPALNLNSESFLFCSENQKLWLEAFNCADNKHQTVFNRKIKKGGMEKLVLGVGQFFFFSVCSKQICSLSIPWAQVDDKFMNIIFFVAFPCFGFPFKDCCKIRFRSAIFNASHLTNMTTDDRKSTNAPKHQSNKSPPHQSTKGW